MESSESEECLGMVQSPPRLGLCEVCNTGQAKYTCPKCEVKSCCLKCINIHKKELSCDGIRDRTKYVALRKMTKMDMMSDYYFLEEATRFVDDRKRDKIKRFTRYNKNLPTQLFRLRCAARDRGTAIRFLLPNFTRNQQNTTQLNFKTGVIHWRLEWNFPNAEGLVFTDERCDENEKLYVLMNKYLETTNGVDFPGKNKLEFYQSRGLNQLKVLLKAEGIKRSRNRFFDLDPKHSLKEAFKGKTIVEFPSLYILFKESTDGFDVIESDEDVEAETKMYQKFLDDNYGYHRRNQHVKQEGEQDGCSKDVLAGIDKLEIARKREIRRKKREAASTEPANLLFSDESLWNQYSSDSEDGQVTEEEDGEMQSPKRLKTERE